MTIETQTKKEAGYRWVHCTALQHTDDVCLPWPFSTHAAGNGSFRRAVITRGVGALAYVCERAHGPRPSEEYRVTRLCETLHCCNPKHLRWMTHERSGRVSAAKRKQAYDVS